MHLYTQIQFKYMKTTAYKSRLHYMELMCSTVLVLFRKTVMVSILGFDELGRHTVISGVHTQQRVLKLPN